MDFNTILLSRQHTKHSFCKVSSAFSNILTLNFLFFIFRNQSAEGNVIQRINKEMLYRTNVFSHTNISIQGQYPPVILIAFSKCELDAKI